MAAALALFVAGCGSSAPSGPSEPAAAAGPFVGDGPAAEAQLWAVGDGPPGPGAAAVARLIAKAGPDRVLYLGDVYPMGTAAAFRDSYAPTYGAFADNTAPTPGNHDWPVRANGYNAYWRNVQGSTPPPWYSFRAGGWQILSLNSETEARSAELGWLRRQLGGRTTCRLAFWHRPRYSAGPHGDARDMDPFWRALQGHARLVVSGHDHDMERLRARGGLVQFVSGAGGHSHYALDRTHPSLAFADNTHYGALRMTLRPGSARLAFVSATGKTLDSSRLACHR